MEIKTLVTVPIAVGDLFDKITILQVKEKRLANPDQVEVVKHELIALTQIAAAEVKPTPLVTGLIDQLRTVNDFLWDLEDEIRDAMNSSEVGHSRVAGLVGTIHRNNDRRARIKRRLNELTGSQIVEVKKYATQDEV